jgi:micrococcal nuclease
VSRLRFGVLAGLVGAVMGCLCSVVALGAILLSSDALRDSGATLVAATQATRAPAAVAPSSTASETGASTFTATMTPSASATAAWSPTPTYIWTPTPSPCPTPSATKQPPTPAPSPKITLGTVVGIVDGDTIEVEIEGEVYRLRYIGIDSPEPGQPGWSEAMEANRCLVAGQTVRLEKDVSETDQYGRLLRYVYLGNLLVNAELVRQGHAVAADFPPDTAYADLLAQLQAEAQQEGRGLWASSPESTPGTGWTCVGNLYNCDSFSSCEEVMSYWQACPGDPSRLDGDHDGRPCESLCRQTVSEATGSRERALHYFTSGSTALNSSVPARSISSYITISVEVTTTPAWRILLTATFQLPRLRDEVASAATCTV